METNSLTVYRWIKGLEEIVNLHVNMIQECKHWLEKDRVISVKHIYKEGNQAADKMAKLSLYTLDDTFTSWRKPQRIWKA